MKPRACLTHSGRAVGLALLALWSMTSAAVGDVTDQALYQELRAAGVDGRSVEVRDLTLRRGTFELRFASGRFHFLERVAGRTPGAVFVGEGSYLLDPSAGRGPHYLAAPSDEEGALVDDFSKLVLLFGDDTERRVVGDQIVELGNPDREAAAVLRSWLANEAPGLETTGDASFCSLWSLVGLPAVSLPLLAGPNGLPVGVQLVGPLGDDARLLRTARWLTRALSEGEA